VLTRPFLERLPDNKFDWQPHPKSMPLGKLASHITEMPGNINDTFNSDSYDLNTAAPSDFPQPAGSRAEVLARFDANAAAARQALTNADEPALAHVWVMSYGDQVVIRQPRAQIVRELLLDHLIHHRAQLGVYLRMLDIPVPGTYGPTADEPEFDFTAAGREV
jgi:uncharacterized damage-inducible protein DinB